MRIEETLKAFAEFLPCLEIVAMTWYGAAHLVHVRWEDRAIDDVTLIEGTIAGLR